MSIHVFARRNFKGEEISGFDADNLGQLSQPMRPSSARLTAESDRILFFTRPNWKGRVMFRTGVGVKEIANLGHPGDGGKIGFENTISSMRITPFELRVHTHIIVNRDGAFPGTLASEGEARLYVQDVIQAASDVWSQGLIRLTVDGIAISTSDKFFNMKGDYVKLIVSAQFDIDKNDVNMFLVNSIADDGTIGISAPRIISQRLAVDFIEDRANAGANLAHEIGHFLGIEHASAKGDPNNLMFPSGFGALLSQDQIEDAQAHFADVGLIRRDVRVE